MSEALEPRVSAIAELIKEVAKDRGDTISPFLIAQAADLCDTTLSGANVLAEAERQISEIRESNDRRTLTHLLKLCETEALANAKNAISRPDATQQLQDAVSLALFRNAWVKRALMLLGLAFLVTCGMLFYGVLQIQNQAGEVANIRRAVDQRAEEARQHLSDAENVVAEGRKTLTNLSNAIDDVEGQVKTRLDDFDNTAKNFSEELKALYDTVVEEIEDKPAMVQDTVSAALRAATNRNTALNEQAEDLKGLFDTMHTTATGHENSLAEITLQINGIMDELLAREAEISAFKTEIPGRINALLKLEQPTLDEAIRTFRKEETKRQKDLLDGELTTERAQLNATLTAHSVGLTEQGLNLKNSGTSPETTVRSGCDRTPGPSSSDGSRLLGRAEPVARAGHEQTVGVEPTDSVETEPAATREQSLKATLVAKRERHLPSTARFRVADSSVAPNDTSLP